LSSLTSDALYVVNVSSYPWIQEHSYVDAVGLAAPAALHFKSDYIFSADDGLVSIIRTATTESFTFVWERSNTPIDEAWAVKYYGNRLAVVSKTSKTLTILDVSDLTDILYIGSITDATKLNGVCDLAWFGSGQYIIVTSQTYDGVVVYDVSDPLNITESDFLQVASLNNCKSVVVDTAEDFAYVGAEAYINVIDISDPAAIAIEDTLNDAGKYAGLDGLAFVDTDTLCGIGTYYINTWDISTPSSISRTGGLYSGVLSASRCVSDGTYLYVTTLAGNSVRIYDITNPDVPVFNNEITGLTGAYGIAYNATNSLLWVAADDITKVCVYDIAVPTAPVLLDSLTDDNNFVSINLIDATGFNLFGACPTIDQIVALSVGGTFEDDISSIFQFKNEQGVDTVILVAGDLVMADIGGNTYRGINGALTLPSNGVWRWGIIDGVLFGVHGVAPGGVYPQVVYWDGEADGLLEVTDFPVTLLAATQLDVWNHRLFVLASDSVYYSKLGDGTDFSDSTAGSLDAFSDDGDTSTGLQSHKGLMFIFKQKHIYRLVPGTPNTADADWSLELVNRNSGSISGESIQSVLDDLLFLSSEGVTTLGVAEKFGDFETMMLSKKIAELQGMSLTTTRVPAIYWSKKSQYWISVDTDGDGVLDKTYVLDMKDSMDGNIKWTVFTGTIVGTAFAVVEVDGVNELYIGGSQLYKQDESVYTDNGTSFTTEILTKAFDLELPSHRKESLRWGIEFVKKTSALTLEVSLLYDGVTVPVHTYNIDAGTLDVDLPHFVKRMITGRRRWKRFQKKIVNSGAEAFDLESLYFEIEPLTIKAAGSL